VEQALKNYPETRSSDRKLVVKVWELQAGKEMNDQLKEFLIHEAIFPDSITRVRRKFQQHGKYRATKAVEEVRYEQYKHMTETAPRVSNPNQLGLI
jgi:hypothetical protein